MQTDPQNLREQPQDRTLHDEIAVPASGSHMVVHACVGCQLVNSSYNLMKVTDNDAKMVGRLAKKESFKQIGVKKSEGCFQELLKLLLSLACPSFILPIVKSFLQSICKI